MPYYHFKGFQSCDVLLSHSPYFCTVQGHTSNPCFHDSFLEASSYFSILPLVILSSWKRLLSHCYPGASILGAEGRGPPIFGGGGPGGGAVGGGGGGPRPVVVGRGAPGRVAGGSWLVVKYYYYVRKWLLLKRNRIIWPKVALNRQFFSLKIEFF